MAAMATTPLCPPVHKTKIVFRSFLLTGARHTNRAVICTTAGTGKHFFCLPRGMHREGGLLSSVYLGGKAIFYIMVITDCAEMHGNHTSFQS